MSAMRARGGRDVGVRRRAVVFLPNGLTLFNLFCGIYAIVKATRGDLSGAAFFVVLGGIADALDGRVARATGTGSRIGAELDSLVDAISFGFAPAMIMYFAVLNRENWEWLLIFIFTSCAVLRLARFNVEQAGRKKTYFHGLPSPAAGLTLATYYWFSQTNLYNQAVILFTDSKTLSDLPWHTILRGLMAVLAALMISEIPYPAVPSIGFRSVRQAIGSFIVLASILGLIFLPRQFLFPALLAYVLYGVVRSAVLGFLGRSKTPQELFWDEEPSEEPGVQPMMPQASRQPSPESVPPAARGEKSRAEEGAPRRRRRRRGPRGGASGASASGGSQTTPPTGRTSRPPASPKPSDPTKDSKS